MKLLLLVEKARYEKFLPDLPITRAVDMTFCPKGTANAEAAGACPDAEVLCVDSLTVVDRELMSLLPRLRMIHVEGVGTDQVDTAFAAQKGVFVCNNPGCNASGVAEHAIFLMLSLLRQGPDSHFAVMTGHQKELNAALFQDQMPELGDCTVGLVGFGDIGRAVAVRLGGFGCQVYYNARQRRAPEEEAACGAAYLPLEELAARCDIVSLHCPATPETTHLVNADFLRRMKPGAYLINTARGAVVDNEALIAALASGHLAGAGLDAFDPEPVLPGHPLLTAPAAVKDRLVLTPHSAGLTVRAFRQAHENIWNDIALLAAGERPNNVVNGI